MTRKHKQRAKTRPSGRPKAGGSGASSTAEAEQRRLAQRAAAERREAASAAVAEEDAEEAARERRIRLKLETRDPVPEDEPKPWEFTSTAGSIDARTAEGPATEDGTAPQGSTDGQERSLGFKIGSGDSSSREISQKGWLVNDEGEDHISSVGWDDDGVEATGINLAEGWNVDFVAKKDEQKVAFNAPTEWKFPPDEGFEMDLFPSLAVPLAPGIGVEASGALESQVAFENVVIAAERTRSDRGDDDPYEQVSRWKLSGTGSLAASAGIKLEASIVGGVPVIANLSLTARATAETKLESAVDVGGYLDFTQTVPQPGETRELLSTDGQLYVNLTGGGSIQAVLAALVGVEVLSFKGELYELSIIDTPLAALRLGGSIQTAYSNGVFTPGFEPLVGTRGVEFDWLLRRYFSLRRFDAATKAVTESKADVSALKQLKAGAVGGVSVAELVSDPTFDRAKLVTGEVRSLQLERERLQALLEAKQADILLVQAALDGPLKEQNEEAQAKRWAASNWVWGDIASFKAATASLTAARKEEAALNLKLAALEPRIAAAQEAFVRGLDGDRIDELITAARLKKHETRRANYALYQTELEQIDALHTKKRAALDAKIDPLVVKLEKLRVRVRDYDTIGASEIAAHRLERARLDKLVQKATNRLANNGAQIVGKERKLAKLEAAHEAHLAGLSYFSWSMASASTPEIDQLGAEVEALHAATEGFEEALGDARAAVTAHAATDPRAALVRSLGSLEGALMALERERVRLDDDHVEQQERMAKLLFGEWSVEQRAAEDAEATRERKKAKYAEQYGEGGALETAESEAGMRSGR